jgi:hypothetical protein
MKIFPHDKVYTRLGVSKVCEGIGVFAILDIPKGTDVFEMDTLGETIEFSEEEVNKLPESIRKMYVDFCPLNDGVFTCPVSFAMLTPSWYMNHDEIGNVSMSDDLESIISIRDINNGEEILCNYHTYSEIPEGEKV